MTSITPIYSIVYPLIIIIIIAFAIIDYLATAYLSTPG